MAIVALVGRPNVGKSSLFNRLIGERRSIEAAEAGTTRDRVYGHLTHKSYGLTLIDVAGVSEQAGELANSIKNQIEMAKREADLIILVVNASEGLTDEDKSIARDLRHLSKPIIVVANKADNRALETASLEFSELGFKDQFETSAIHNVGLTDLLDRVVQVLPKTAPINVAKNEIKVALIGRPNVGKSSLLNRYVGKERSTVSAMAGTTRDAIDAVVQYKERQIRFIDTAGIRRAGSVETGVEHFSVLRSLRAVEACDVSVVLIDAVDGPTHGDARIAGMAQDAGKGIIFAVNKWDLKKSGLHQNVQSSSNPKISDDDQLQRQFLANMGRVMAYLPYVPVVFISATAGLNTPKLMEQIRTVQNNRLIMLDQNQLDLIKLSAESSHTHMPMLYAIIQVSVAPPTFELIVNRPETWHFSQVRFIENQIRQVEPYLGTPIVVNLVKKAYSKK